MRAAPSSIAVRFFLMVFVLAVIAFVAFGLIVAQGAGRKWAEQSRHLVGESERALEEVFEETAASQADLMDRAVQHVAENVGRELEDVPFDVFEDREDLLVSYLKERLDEARRRNQENSKIIADLFRKRAAERVAARLAQLDERQNAEAESWAASLSRRMLLWGGVFLVGIAAVIGVAFVFTVLRPLRRATDVIEAIRGGDLGRRIPTSGSEELTRLAASFNAMAAELESYQKDLQAKVEDKTAALSRALTEQQATNERLRAALEELERTQRHLVDSEKMAALGAMAQGMAHEFANILGGIGGCAEDLLEDAEDPDVREVIEVILRTSQRALFITENLLSFSRRARNEEMERSRTSLHEVLTTAASLVEPEAARRGIEVILEGEPLDPVETDARGLQQVFLNLLVNAVQACGPGDRVHVALSCEDEVQKVVIEDTGCGIEEEHLDRIFDPLFTTKDDAGQGRRGTGLGLSVSLGIVRALGGVITASSGGPGCGSRFTVTIPRRGAAR